MSKDVKYNRMMEEYNEEYKEYTSSDDPFFLHEKIRPILDEIKFNAKPFFQKYSFINNMFVPRQQGNNIDADIMQDSQKFIQYAKSDIFKNVRGGVIKRRRKEEIEKIKKHIKKENKHFIWFDSK